MPNTILTPDIIAREALMVLRNNAVMANLVHRDFSEEFVAGVGDKITVRKPAKFEICAGIQNSDCKFAQNAVHYARTKQPPCCNTYQR